MATEQEKFLNSAEVPVDVFDQPLEPAPEKPAVAEGEQPKVEGAPAEGDDTEGEGLQPRNRRERRLMAKLQSERESSIDLAARLETVTEARKATSEESDYLKSVERIYGTDTPEASAATDLLKKAITGAREEATKRAIEFMQDERKKEAEDARKAEDALDEMVEEIEDEHGITLTEAQERGFFQMLEKMSPKDKRGNITEYADPHAVWDVFKDKLTKRTDTRAKDLSSRTLVQSGSSKESKLTDDAQARYLREAGII